MRESWTRQRRSEGEKWSDSEQILKEKTTEFSNSLGCIKVRKRDKNDTKVFNVLWEEQNRVGNQFCVVRATEGTGRRGRSGAQFWVC